jgi:hypothetical protein
MSEPLNAPPEFYHADREPYDRSDLALNSDGKPVSVWSALEYMREHEPVKWHGLAQDVFDLRFGRQLTLEAVLEKIQETNRCSNYGVPVEVWIDPNGDYMIEVYDRD